VSFLVNAAANRTAVFVPLPCGHHRARLAGRGQAVRRCATCRVHWLIEFSAGGLAVVTGISCAACGAELGSMGDMWTCPSCGDEYDDDTIRGSRRYQAPDQEERP
jgi:predicted RNA-binding Zn-ribbon protein involved in translation (DUF1610 family)